MSVISRYGDGRIVGNAMFLLILLRIVYCYPLNLPTGDFKPEIKDEIRFPNGTVVGKYAYTDEEGNPIHVKYYANPDSYGVELNSIKIVDTTPSPNTDSTENMSENFEELPENSKQKQKTMPEDSFKELNAHALDYTKETLKPEFETFFENDLATPSKCNREKIRIYNFEKKRKIRSNNDVSDICSRV